MTYTHPAAGGLSPLIPAGFRARKNANVPWFYDQTEENAAERMRLLRTDGWIVEPLYTLPNDS